MHYGDLILDTRKTQKGRSDKEESSWVPKRRALAVPGGYTKVFQPTPSHINQSIKTGTHMLNINIVDFNNFVLFSKSCLLQAY